MELVINSINILDVINEEIYKSSLRIKNGIISQISTSPLKSKNIIDGKGKFLSPAFLDAHFHIESTNLTPLNFAEAVIPHGTCTVIADCHEICNVAGMAGFEYFRNECRITPMDIYLTAPSCVPASPLGTNGATIGLREIDRMFKYKDVIALGEVMDFPGVIKRDPQIISKINLAKKEGKIINGHAPNLRGEKLRRYITAGIKDDHESVSYREIKEKLSLGMNIFLREGSAEHLPDNCYSLLNKYKNNLMFCSDDKLASDLIHSGHINYNVKKAVDLGIEPIRAVRAATYNTARYYKLQDTGSINLNKKANLIIFDNLKDFQPDKVIYAGKVLFEKKQLKCKNYNYSIPQDILNQIFIDKIQKLPRIPNKYSNLAIGAIDGSVVTEKLNFATKKKVSIKDDRLKLVVVERYGKTNNISTCFVKGFGLKDGAIASSIAHDCHNIVAAGTNDDDIIQAVNLIIENKGGLSLSQGNKKEILELPIAGLMSKKKCKKVAKELNFIQKKAKELDSKLTSPFGTLSFLALEVIPNLKLSDKGLVDVNKFILI